MRSGAILDIGCGSFPVFLKNTRFGSKYGIDRLDSYTDSREGDVGKDGIVFILQDIMEEQELPFESGKFEVVSMLAVIEHLDPKRLITLIKEIHRVLKPGGSFVLTTPASWTHGLLKFISRMGLVSREEIDEHEYQYTREEMRMLLARSNFEDKKIKTGFFELFMNIWVVANK